MHCAPSPVPDQTTANRRSVSGLLGLCCVILQCASAAAQPTGPEPIRAWGLASLDDGLQVLDSVPVFPVPGIYAAALAREALEDQAFGPLPVASVFRTSIVAFDNREGLTEESQLVDSDRQLTWRLRLASAGSESLGVGFTRYNMPPGGRLFVFTPDYQEILGPFTDADNRSHGELWIPRLPGEEIVVEISVPADAVADLQVEIGAVERGFLDRQSDAWMSCQIDVVCDEGRHHRDAIRSVAYLEITGPSLVYGCSGALINNTRYDLKPYLLTAFHCGSAGEDHDVGTWWTTSKAASLKVYWNYESPTCGARSGGSLRHSQVGATVQAGYYNTDFALLLLDEEPMPTAGYRQFFAGWNRDPTRYNFVVGIHHPGGTEKSLAVDDRGPYGANVYPTSSAWGWDWCPSGDLCDGLIVYWDKGVPSGRSSGSPLFNGRERILGQLWGGATDRVCGNSRYGPTTGPSKDRRGRSLSGMSSYGWLKGSWTGGGTASTRLRDWLDPGGVTNSISIPGIDVPTENSNLVVRTPVASPASLRPNQIFSLYATVSNVGRGPSPRTHLRWYRRRVEERWSLMFTRAILSIPPSNSRTQRIINGQAAPREPGEYQYAACVNVVRYESNTTDNCSRALSVTVRDVAGMPDLVVRNARVSDSTPVVGQQFRLYAEVRNIGTAASETTRLRYWRRPLEGNWERVGDNDYVPPFVPGRRVRYSTLLTAQPGMHEYTACVVPVRGEPSGSNCSRPYLTVTGLEHTGTPPYDGTVWITQNLVDSSDPTSLRSVTFAGRGMREFWDRQMWTTVNVYLFDVQFTGRELEFQVHPEFGSREAARSEVDTYAPPLGRIPAVLLSRAKEVEISASDHPFQANVAGFFHIFTVEGEELIGNGFLEEVLIHEGGHASLEGVHADSTGWRAAQAADRGFISTYARDNPQVEDVSESILPYFALRYRPERLTEADRAAIAAAIPNRLAYFDEQGFDMSPYRATRDR